MLTFVIVCNILVIVGNNYMGNTMNEINKLLNVAIAILEIDAPLTASDMNLVVSTIKKARTLLKKKEMTQYELFTKAVRLYNEKANKHNKVVKEQKKKFKEELMKALIKNATVAIDSNGRILSDTGDISFEEKVKEANKSPQQLYKESMSELERLINSKAKDDNA